MKNSRPFLCCGATFFGLLLSVVWLSAQTRQGPGEKLGSRSQESDKVRSSQFPDFVPGEVLVKLKQRRDVESLLEAQRNGVAARLASGNGRAAAAMERFGVSRVEEVLRPLNRTVKLVSDSLRQDPDQTKELVRQLRRDPAVEYAELNVILRTQFVPNDPYYGSSGSWGQSLQDLWGLHKIDAAAAWDRSLGRNVVVAVIDTGVDFTHPDITGNAWLNPGETGPDGQGRDKAGNGLDDDLNGYVDDWRGWDFASNDNDAMDDHGHGTHVAGTIAAMGNNGLGIIGVAPESRVMALKALDANGFGSVSAISEAILYAANRSARVINLSLGVFGETPKTLVDVISHAHDVRGVVVVAAAGNDDGKDIGTPTLGFFPANIRDVIAVSAFDHTDRRASFSNIGAKVDVAAPGGGGTDPNAGIYEPQRSILSLLSSRASDGMTGSGRLIVGEKYLRQAGTSMAAPHVSGVAALVLGLHPEFSSEQVRQAIRRGSVDVVRPGFDTESGYGRLHAAGAAAIATPLSVQLTEPIQLIVEGPAAIQGTAEGPDLANWELSFGEGITPVNWIPLASSSTPVREGLLMTWDVSEVKDGSHTLRLVATNAHGESFEDRLVVTIDRVSITEPRLDGPIPVYGPGKPVTLKGTIDPAHFSRYEIRVWGLLNGWLDSPRTELPNDGLQPVRNGLLGTWDPTGLPADHYKVYVYVTLADGSAVEEFTRVIVDLQLHAGWPQRLSPDRLTPHAHLTAEDLDGDGDAELLVALESTVRVLVHDGSSLPGWPQSVDVNGSVIRFGPVTGDLTGDGRPEVVVVNHLGFVYIWEANGRLLDGWPKQLAAKTGRLAIDDINGDGVNEVILVTAAAVPNPTLVTAFDAAGVMLPGWPQTLMSRFGVPAPAVGDLDGDGKKEIVVVNNEGESSKLYAFRSDGSSFPGWPKVIAATNAPVAAPALGDLNGDSRLEIVTEAGTGEMHAFHHDGTSVTGWPQSSKLGALKAPAIGDLDGDGKLEVVAAEDGIDIDLVELKHLARVYAWQGDGSLVPGWPVKWRFENGLAACINYRLGSNTPALVDIDGDGRVDVIESRNVTDCEYPFAINGFTNDGAPLADFPKPTVNMGPGSDNSIAIADLDGDGLLEMAWIDGDFERFLYVWDLEAPASGRAPWPMYGRNSRHTRNAAPDSSPSFEPDLTVTAVDWPASVDRQNYAEFTFRLKNEGNAAVAAGQYVNQLYVDGQRIDNVNGNVGMQPGPALGPGETATQELVWCNTTCGPHKIAVKTDDTDSVKERKEDNNETAEHTLTVTCPIRKPDLTVAAASAWPASVEEGKVANFVYMVKNVGTADALPRNGAIITRLYVEDNPVQTPGGAGQMPRLAAGASNTSGLQWTPRAGSCGGAYKVHIVTDDTQVVEEAKEDNNKTPEHTLKVTCPNGQILDYTGRIAYWWGKVNQHVEDGVWKTDPDGVSGANLDRLAYCRKWYPNTSFVEPYREELISDWKARGNQGSYTRSVVTDRCVDETPRIAYWWGKVNQHVERGNWQTDPDGLSGANLDKLTYCRKWYPGTLRVASYRKETLFDWKEAGNVNSHARTVETFECEQPRR